jgi:small conductance mechanosensitive channel
MTRAAGGGGFPIPDTSSVVFVVVGFLVFVAFAIAARLLAPAAAKALLRRQLRPDQVVIAGRVLTFALIGFGAVFAISFAIRSENVALAGIVLATIIASFGVQDLLKDYVSGYYVLLERHIRVGDHISVEQWSGTVTDVKLRVTLLRSDAGDQVVVPNSELFGRPVIVRARSTNAEVANAHAPDAKPSETQAPEAKPDPQG